MGKGDSENQGWTVVQRKRKQTKQGNKSTHSIFLYNFPEEVTTQKALEMFKNCGKILDIILPRKRDKKNKRYGFVHTVSIEEAGLIISNAKKKGGLSTRIKISINNPEGKKENVNIKVPKIGSIDVMAVNLQKAMDAQQSSQLGKKMEFTETVVDEEIEKGLFQTRIGFIRSEEHSNVLQNK